MTNKNTNRSAKYTQIQKELAEFYNEPTTALAILAFRKGASSKEIADALRVDKSTVSKKYKIIFDAIRKEGK